MSYGRVVSARGLALAAVSRAARKNGAGARFRTKKIWSGVVFRCLNIFSCLAFFGLAQNEVPRSPAATQRRQFRSHTTPSARWAHRGASMRRHGSPIARRRARSRAAEHPKMAARAASAARAVPRRRKKRCHGAQARPRGASLAPLSPPEPPGPTLVRQCGATARRSRDCARVRAPPNTPKWPRGRPRRRARCRGGA